MDTLCRLGIRTIGGGALIGWTIGTLQLGIPGMFIAGLAGFSWAIMNIWLDENAKKGLI